MALANQSGVGAGAASSIVRSSQGATVMLNKMNTLHAGAGTGDLTEGQLAQMAKTAGKEDKGHEYSKESMLKYHAMYQKMRALIGQ